MPSLAVQFGKSENYIRTRLKFLSLIPEIAELLEADELTVGVAGAICRYGEDIQRDVYDNHLKEGVYGYNSWRGLKASDVAKNIERQYTTDLDRYRFDKTLCMSCPHNTNNMTLFCEGGCGNCTNRSCLDETNASYLAEKAVQLMELYPATLCHREYCYNETVVERLASMGYEVETLKTYAEEYPEQPVAPEKADYDTAEQYEQAYTEYERASADYTEECEMIRERVAAGEMAYYLRIDNDDITLCYRETADTAPEQQISPMEKLEKQDARNREIALEKTVEDTKKRILEVDMADTKFGADEDRMIYFFLLSSLRREHFAAVGIECGDAYHYLTDEEKMRIIDNLTAKEKALIRRDYLLANFKGAFGSNAIASLLLDFAQKHMPETLADIKSGHNEVYEKRHKRIEEKKAVLLAQEKAAQEAARPEEPQAETDGHTDAQPAEVAA